LFRRNGTQILWLERLTAHTILSEIVAFPTGMLM
jgi:hypothetical protein